MAAAKIVFLVYDHSDPTDKGSEKLTRARHANLEDAKTQAEVDIEHGRTVVRIEDAKGATIWEP